VYYHHHHHHHHHRLYSPGRALVSSWGFVTIFFLRVEVVSLTPNPQSGGPGYPFLSGSSPLTCLAMEALPVAYATANIALEIMRPHKPHHYAKVRTRVLYCLLNLAWSCLQLLSEHIQPNNAQSFHLSLVWSYEISEPRLRWTFLGVHSVFITLSVEENLKYLSYCLSTLHSSACCSQDCLF